MDIIKIIGVGTVALIIIIILKQYKPEFAMYASIIAGAIIVFLSLDKISAIINLLSSLSNKTGLNAEYLRILLKITGIAILTEFAVSICKDSRRKCNSKQNRFRRKNNSCKYVYTNNFSSFRNNTKNYSIEDFLWKKYFCL